jgi:hypothetical protein
MRIEQITLTVPAEPDEVITVQAEPPVRADDDSDRVELADVVRDYLAAVRARDRFALTERTRVRRRERFGLAVRSLAKNLATEATRTENDKIVRNALRARVYTTMAALLDTVSRDQLKLSRRARGCMRWGVGLALFGLGCLVAAGALAYWGKFDLLS